MWEKIERLLSKRIGVWIIRIKNDLQPLAIFALTAGMVWQTIQVYRKDKIILNQQDYINSLHDQRHSEDREDTEFFINKYFEIVPYVDVLKTLKKNEKAGMDSTSHILGRRPFSN